ncbi:S-adenosyl-L-methionine-dependent methyltransferase [Aspergillus recurvatus]
MLLDTNDQIFAQDDAFWNNYSKGRPQPPPSFFQRIYTYHEQQNGRFDTAHDVGAGNGVYSKQLRSKFQHVIVSDVASDNVRQAEQRLGTDGYSYRVSKMEETKCIMPGSVDLVFAMNAIHWADQTAAMQAIAAQLRPGGTFACAGFGPARFEDAQVQEVWERISEQGGRLLLKTAERPADTISVMARSEDWYNVAPLDERLFRPGAQRIHLNMETGGLTSLIPPENRGDVTEPDYTGPNDVILKERDEEWGFEMDLEGFMEHFRSFPHAFRDPEAFAPLWQEVEDLVRSGCRLNGYWPVTLILATRV